MLDCVALLIKVNDEIGHSMTRYKLEAGSCW